MRIWRDTGEALSEALAEQRKRDERGLRIFWSIWAVPNAYLRKLGAL